MKRPLLASPLRLSVLLLTVLASCAPVTSRQTASLPLQASFSSSGVIWNEGGRVTLARAPGFQKVAVQVPAGATAVGWQVAGQQSVGQQSGGPENTPWVALGQLGLLITADGRPITVQAGRVVALSSTRAYREDGSTAGYDGTPGPGLLGAPGAVVTGGDGADYAVQDGNLYRLGGQTNAGQTNAGQTNTGQTLLSGAAQPYLYADLTGVATANAPTAVTPDGRYTLTGTALERRDAAGVLLASIPHPAGAIGVVGNLIVTVQPGGLLRFFAPDLREFQP